jgi:hypothetical protein
MEVEPSIPNVAANQCKNYDVGFFLLRDALIDEFRIPDSHETVDSSLLHLHGFSYKKS